MPSDTTPPGDGPAVAGELQTAEFLQVAVYPDADSLAAAAMLAQVAQAKDCPFHIRTGIDATQWDPQEDTTTATVGYTAATAEEPVDIRLGDGEPAASETLRVVQAVDGVETDPVLALAALTTRPEPLADVAGETLTLAEDLGYVATRPGVATATQDLTQGLAGMLGVHAPFSGRPDHAQAALVELELPIEIDDDAHQRVEAFVATAATPTRRPAARRALESIIRPRVTDSGPVETLRGYGDILEATSRTAPGVGIALALGRRDPGDAIEVLDAYAQDAHECLRRADIFEYDGFAACRVDPDPSAVDADRVQAVLPTVARLARDYKTTEPACIAVTDGYAASATTQTAAPSVVAAARSLDGDGIARQYHGEAHYDGTATELVTALREAPADRDPHADVSQSEP